MAHAFGHGTDDEVISGINVTPLVDVVLVLLIIFMITAPVIYQSAIKVHLPKAATGDSVSKTPLDFTINQQGDLFWGKEKVDWNTLSDKLRRKNSDLSQETATISADKATPHGVVIQLIDALRSSGITKFALNVESKSSR